MNLLDNDRPHKRKAILSGASRVYQWDDSQANAGTFRNGASALTLDTLTGSIQQFRFDLNNEVFVPAIQFSHGLLEGCTIKPHLHIINKSSRIVSPQTVMNIKFEFEYTWVNINEACPAAVNDPKTFDIGGLAALTHKVLGFTDIVPSAVQGNISSIFMCRIKRVAASTNPYNTNDIFTAGFDLHFQRNTFGSQQEYIK